MTEEIIANAGQKPGREIWRVEAFELGVVDPKMHGNFYRGDAYIILNTKQDKKSSKLTWDIHFWLGDECSQDESGSAAILTGIIAIYKLVPDRIGPEVINIDVEIKHKLMRQSQMEQWFNIGK